MTDEFFNDILPGLLQDNTKAKSSTIPSTTEGSTQKQEAITTNKPVVDSKKLTSQSEHQSVKPFGNKEETTPQSEYDQISFSNDAVKDLPLFGNPEPALSSWGILGRVSGQTVRYDLQYPKLMSVFGQIGSGKSYLAGVLTEMSAMKLPSINCFRTSESAVVVFNYRKSREARFEYGSFLFRNDIKREINLLSEIYSTSPSNLNPMFLQVCAYSRELQNRRDTEYAGMNSHPLLFKSEDLEDDDWMLLMGMPDEDAIYIQAMRNIIEDLGYSDALSLENIRIEVDGSNRLSDSQKNWANMRLDFASRYLDDNNGLSWSEIIRPGTVTIIDLRRRQGRADDALRLCLVVLSVVRSLSSTFHKFVLFDEFHEYYDKIFSNNLDNVARMARHHNWTLCLATQNTNKVDRDLLRLFSNKCIFQVDSATWNDLKSADERLAAVEFGDIASLQKEKGECYALFDECNDSRYSGVPIKLNVRPRVTKHGGTTAGQE